jgi:predicted acylesterase/phospholipase RssA
MIKNATYQNIPFYFLCFVQLFPAIVSANAPANEKDAVPYVLTISGGVSLGAYEAGLNWALTNYLKVSKNQIKNGQRKTVPPRLSTVTGASAGSINGLLTVISWCVDDSKLNDKSEYRGSVTDNLFKEIWVDVGLDGLLPKDPNQYKDTDGLFSRIPFNTPLDKVREIMSEKIFEPGCAIPFGITVTDEAPKTIEIAGISVNNQRHFIPLLLKSDEDGSAAFYAYPVDQSDPNYGNVIYLPPENKPTANQTRYKTGIDQVIQAVLASSAFPVAFGRVQLDYCSPPAIDGYLELANPQATHNCPGSYSPQTAVFVDGGVFDNIPLGSAKALAEEHLSNTARRSNYIFMDPDNRRHLSQGSGTHSTGPTVKNNNTRPDFVSYNLIDQLKFIGGAVLTARNYELYKVMTSGDWNSQTSYYANLLTRLIDGKLAQGKGSTATKSSPDCDAFYATLPDNTVHLPNKQLLNDEWLRNAKYCINKESNALEYRYQYLPTTTAEFQSLRGKLVDHLAAIANIVKGRSLAQQIARTKTDDLGDRRILLSSRFFPLTGAYLGAFGAFFDRPFRQFDYYVGVYDGTHDIASYACQFRRNNYNGAACQTGTVVKSLYDAFNIASDADARYVFAMIARLEHPDYTDKASSWHWINTINTSSPSKQTRLLFETLNMGFDRENILTPPKFDDFIADLKEKNYTTANSSEYFKYITEKDKEWWVLPSVRVSDRLYKLEANTEKQTGEKSLLKRPLATVSYVAHHFDEGGKLISFEQPSSAPSTSLLKWLPYEVGIRANHDHTPYLAWEPTLNILGKEMLRLKITPVQADSRDNHSENLYQVSFMHNFTEHKYFTVGAAFDINGAWHERDNYDRVTAGLSMNIEIKKKLRVTFGFYDLYDHFTAYNYYLNVGLTDIAGYFH